MTTPDGLPAERPRFTLAHLSDTHLTSVGTRYNGVLDADAALARAVDLLRTGLEAGTTLDAVVVSGDLTDSGDPDAYARLAAALDGLAPTLVFATGNHDLRVQFHRSLLDRDDEGPVLQLHALPGLRLIVLDSTVPGAGHGRLDPSHLAELAAVLAQPHPGGTVLVLHHPPIPAPSTLHHYFALQRDSRRALAEIIAGTDVRLILAGHHHLPTTGLLAGVPVAVAGSTAIRTDPLARPGHERTTAHGSVNLVRFYDDTQTVMTLDTAVADEVFDLDPAGCADVIGRHPVTRTH